MNPPCRLKNEHGAALVTALVFLTALGALAGAYAMNARATISQRGSAGVRRSAFYAAEAGLNVGVSTFANIFRNSGVPQGIDFEQSLSVADKSVTVDLDQVAGCDPCPPAQIPEGEVFAGLNTIAYRYTVQSKSQVPPGDSTARVAGEFDIHNIPIFQFLAFVDSHLFIMPLPNMTLHGRLHTNDDLYIQPDNTLVIEDEPPVMPNVQITSAGDIYRGGYKYNNSWRCWGTTVIDRLADVLPPLNNLDPKPLTCPVGNAPLDDATIAGWNGSIRSHVRNIVTPPVDIIARGTGEYWGRADLRIVLDLGTTPVVTDFAAADLCLGGAGIPPVAAQPALFPIEVQDAGGTVDAAKTRQLLRFMCERRGALFYNDIPAGVNPVSPNPGLAGQSASYSPAFGGAGDDRVYRRVGEDTSGNGSLSTWDGNPATCASGPGPEPWWSPPNCPWPNGTAFGGPALPADSWYRDMDYRRGGFFNHRENQWMYLLNLNLRALIEWNSTNGDPLFPHDDRSDGGLVVFLSVDGPASMSTVNNYGVRIFDSADLDMLDTTFTPGAGDPTGVTVVSDQAAIIQGNFNKRDKYPAAVLADAIWILSQGWEVESAGGRKNDHKSQHSLNSNHRNIRSLDLPGGGIGKQASFASSNALVVNAALLFGLGPSTLDPDWYNGGLENYPKFLESWSSRTLNYRGSFVSLGTAQHKTAEWACGSGNSCNIYDPPIRNYDYDTDFNAVENLPPMTPKVVYVQQRIYTRLYD